MNYVLDACAMIAYLRDEPGADVVERVLSNASDQSYAHAVNLCEVYYDFIRMVNERTARAALRDLRAAGVRTRRDMSGPFWRGIGRLKGAIRHISLADCFAVELSRRLGAEVVTSDHHEFDALARDGLCRVLFIR
jgi:predicted nucleic acid-binding protein